MHPMTAADDAHAELMRALIVERFTHLPENVPTVYARRRLTEAADEVFAEARYPEGRRAGRMRLAAVSSREAS